MGVAGIRATMDQAEDLQIEPPCPLMRPIAPPKPFPKYAFEVVLGDTVGGHYRHRSGA